MNLGNIGGKKERDRLQHILEDTSPITMAPDSSLLCPPFVRPSQQDVLGRAPHHFWLKKKKKGRKHAAGEWHVCYRDVCKLHASVKCRVSRHASVCVPPQTHLLLTPREKAWLWLITRAQPECYISIRQDYSLTLLLFFFSPIFFFELEVVVVLVWFGLGFFCHVALETI